MRRLIMVCLLIFTGINLPGTRAMASDTCWRDSYGRGVGSIPPNCDLHQERQALFCYPDCESGYTGVLNVCWQNCPEGSRDDGAFCRYAEYGRGAGYGYIPLVENRDHARRRCEADQGTGRCERHLEMYYPRCAPGYEAFGCCICRPKAVNCSGMAGRVDLSCTKKTYTRATIVASCEGADMENDAGLCYPRCNSGYDGIGPVCWGTCPATHPVDCGASCARTVAACAEAVTDQVISVVDVAANVAITVATLGSGTGIKAAATSSARAVKVGAQQAARVVARQSVKAAARQGLQQAGKRLSRSQIKASLRSAREAALRKGGEAAQEARKLDEDKLEQLVDVLDKAQGTVEASEDGIDPLEIAAIADPTGLMAVVSAYYSPVCSAPGLQSASTTPADTPPAPGVATGPFQHLVNRWTSEHIHNQSQRLELGGIQPGWWSAQWVLEPVVGEPAFVRIRNRWTDEYLHNQNRRLELGGIQPGWWSAQWVLEPVAGAPSYVRIRNRWTDEYLHNENRLLELGGIQPDWWSAQWVLEAVR